MDQQWLRRRHTVRLGEISLTVTVPAPLEDRIRAHAAYRAVRAVAAASYRLRTRGSRAPSAGHRHDRRTADELPDVAPGTRALYLGGGRSPLLGELSRRGVDVVALDVTDRARSSAAPSTAEQTHIDRVSPDALGSFDLVVIDRVLHRMRSPQVAIERAASVCHGQLVVIATFTPGLEGPGELPLAEFTSAGWVPNVGTVTRMMHVAGCEDIVELSRRDETALRDRHSATVVVQGRVNPDPAWLRAYREWAGTVDPKWRSAEERLA